MSSPLTSHVLDTATGKPASGLPMTLYSSTGSGWELKGSGLTNADGRIPGLLGPGDLTPGTWRASFDTGAWFEGQGIVGFYPVVDIVFIVRDTTEHYHIPLLLSPFGYSTYRGS